MIVQPGPHRAVDTHLHVYDLERFPLHESSGFSILPNEIGTASQFRSVMNAHGITHAVLINPLGGYGVDNRNMLAAIAASEGRFKGIALVPHEITESEYAQLAQQGVVGIRFNLSFPSSPSIHGPGGTRLMALAHEHGHIVQVHYHRQEDFLEVKEILHQCKAQVVIDHCGRPILDEGIDQPAFQALLDLGRRTNAVIKLSAPFRFSKLGWPYMDTDPYVDRLIEAFTLDRCIWGSDWPFLRAKARVDYSSELATLQRWIPDEGDRQKVLWDNPARIFGFQV